MTEPVASQEAITDLRVLLLLLLSLGVASAFLRVDAQSDVKPHVSGTANKADFSQLPISVIVTEQVDLDIYPAGAPSKKMKALRVKVHNRSEAPLIFDGDRSSVTAQNGGRVVAKCIAQRELDAVDRPPTTFTEKLSSDLKATVTAAASVGIVQTAETMKREAGPIEKRYEYDHQRQVNEESRFGRRLVYPGDSTDGNIYFSANTSFEGQLLSMPIKSFYNTANEATLSKPIRANN